MSRKARMRAAAASAVALAIGLSLSTGVIHGVWANFQSETENANSAFGGDYVQGPSSLNTPSTVNGLGATLTWVAGTHNVGNQDIWYADHTTNTNCTSVAYSSLVGGIGATATTISGTGTTNDAVASADNGDNICYQIRSTNTSGWYTVANFGVIQVGLVPTGISFSGTGTGTMAANNTFVITFNQAVTYSGNVNVTATIGNPGTVTLGAIGTISGGNITKGGTCTNSTVTGGGGTSLTVKLVGCPTGGSKIAIATGSTATYTGGSSVTSSSGGVSQCTKTGTPTSGCKPTFTW